MPADFLITLENFFVTYIDLSNENFSYFMSCSSSQESNKEILNFLIESNKSDNQLLAFSFVIQLLAKEPNVAVLFRDG